MTGDNGAGRPMMRWCLAVLVATAAGLAGTGVASAHVTAHVNGEQPEKGGEGAIVLRVPNESEQNTVRVEVTISPDYDLTRVRTRPVPGWRAEIGRVAGGTVTTIIWTALAGAAIPPGDEHYNDFSFTAAPLPENVDQLVFPTKQVYADGSLTDWSEERTGDTEPRYPVPVVELAEPSGAGHRHSQAGPASRAPTWLAVVPLGAAVLIMVGFGTFALARNRWRKQR